MGKIAHIITHDFGRPSMNNLFEAIERSKIEQNLYKKYTSGNGHRNSIENEYCDPSDNTNSILDRYDNIIQLIIGISVPKSGLGKSHGAHVFIMYNVDPYNPARRWQDDIMLDTSGSFGNNTFRERLTDVLERSGLFPAIRVSRIPLVTRRPLRLKNFLDNYTTHNNRIIDLKEKSFYDLDIYP